MTTKYEEPFTYRKTTLDNGLRIVTEEVPYLQSVSLGIWVRSGSRLEESRYNGICHFIEHMLFKGTQRRSAYDIAKEIDSVGGGLNAFTSKELTSFYCKVMDENLELAVDLLTDIFLNASFPEEEIEREKQVVCQEIHQLEDSPEDFVHEMFGVLFWKADPLGQPILGTIPNVVSFDRETLTSFKERAYTPTETVICAAGKVDHEKFVDLIASIMGRLPTAPVHEVPAPPLVEPSSHLLCRDLEQVHICMGVKGPSAVDESRHAGHILNTIFGGGMSSRLFQEIREKNGLAYSVYSFLSSFSNTGLFGIYAGCDPERVEELLTILKRETVKLASGITNEDIQTAKNHLKGNIILAMESSETRMNRLAKGEFYFGRYISMEEIIKSLQNVTAAEVTSLADKVLHCDSFTSVALGPLSENQDLFNSFHE